MTQAYYVQDGEHFHPTDIVTGPWDPDLSHAGPPAALLLHAVTSSITGMGVTRASFEIPRGIPKVPYTVHLEDIRPGRKVRLVSAALRAPDDSTLMAANVWLIRESDDGLPSADPYPLTLPPPDACQEFSIDFGGVGYMDGVEIRTAAGAPFRGGPAAIWIRRTVPLIEGVETDPYTDCGLFGDLGNGISAIEPLQKLIAINTDLTLYLARRPIGEWIAMESLTISQGLGLGMTDSLVYDASGFVGKANQSIFFDRL